MSLGRGDTGQTKYNQTEHWQDEEHRHDHNLGMNTGASEGQWDPVSYNTPATLLI